MVFKKQLNQLLDNLDIWFNDRQPNERKLIMYMPALFLGFFSYQVVLPQVSQWANNEEMIHMRLQNDRNIIQAVRESHNPATFNVREKERDALVNEVGRLKNEAGSLDNTLRQELPMLYYDETKWTWFLSNLSLKAAKYGIVVEKIENWNYDINASSPPASVDTNQTILKSKGYLDTKTLRQIGEAKESKEGNASITKDKIIGNSGKFHKAMFVTTTLKASYASLLKLLWDIEKEPMIIGVESLQLGSETNMSTQITFSLWGVKP